MSKEVETKECPYCESKYKLIYNPSESSGLPKFCTFCGEEAYDEDEVDFEEDEDEE